MELLKKGMQFIDKDGVVKTLLEIGKSSTGETTYIYKKDSFGGSYAYYPEGIDWEETAKLNGIDLDFIEWSNKVGKVLEEVEQQNKNTLSVTDLKQKKEKFKKEELGRKENKGKIRPNLLPITELKEVIRVFEFGVDKYSINNWKHVKDPINEYSNALSRHLLDYLEGEKKASDSNLPHLAHICANALILMWFENNKEE